MICDSEVARYSGTRLRTVMPQPNLATTLRAAQSAGLVWFGAAPTPPHDRKLGLTHIQSRPDSSSALAAPTEFNLPPTLQLKWDFTLTPKFV